MRFAFLFSQRNPATIDSQVMRRAEESGRFVVPSEEGNREYLGQGTFGQVVIGVDTTTGLQCAVKIARNWKELEREREILVLLNAPGKGGEETKGSKYIIKLLGVPSPIPLLRIASPAIAIELGAGSLQSFTDHVWPMGVPRTVWRRACEQLVDALLFLRVKNVAHRDLKPGNVIVMLPADGDVECVVLKMCDFGCSKAGKDMYAGDPSVPQTVVGTPGFMCPDVLRGMCGAETAGLHSLEATLYYIAVRKVAFFEQTVTITRNSKGMKSGVIAMERRKDGTGYEDVHVMRNMFPNWERLAASTVLSEMLADKQQYDTVFPRIREMHRLPTHLLFDWGALSVHHHCNYDKWSSFCTSSRWAAAPLAIAVGEQSRVGPVEGGPAWMVSDTAHLAQAGDSKALAALCADEYVVWPCCGLGQREARLAEMQRRTSIHRVLGFDLARVYWAKGRLRELRTLWQGSKSVLKRAATELVRRADSWQKMVEGKAAMRQEMANAAPAGVPSLECSHVVGRLRGLREEIGEWEDCEDAAWPYAALDSVTRIVVLLDKRHELDEEETNRLTELRRRAEEMVAERVDWLAHRAGWVGKAVGTLVECRRELGEMKTAEATAHTAFVEAVRNGRAVERERSQLARVASQERHIHHLLQQLNDKLGRMSDID